jgi:hypothetical protein
MANINLNDAHIGQRIRFEGGEDSTMRIGPTNPSTNLPWVAGSNFEIFNNSTNALSVVALTGATVLAHHGTLAIAAGRFAKVFLTDETETPAGLFKVGKRYRITSVGSTNFTLIGAASNTVGVEFVATGVGTGSGEAESFNNWDMFLFDVPGGAGAVAPLSQIVVGTGTGITSDVQFTFNVTDNSLLVNNDDLVVSPNGEIFLSTGYNNALTGNSSIAMLPPGATGTSAIDILGGDSAAVGIPGGDILVRGGASAEQAGNITVAGGISTNSDATPGLGGGVVNVTGGNAPQTGTSSNGGQVNITGGESAFEAGQVVITGGAGFITAGGGAVSITGGAAVGNAGGGVSLNGGTSTASNGGSIGIYGATSAAVDGASGGGVEIGGGDTLSTDGTGNGGSIDIYAGGASSTYDQAGHVFLSAGMNTAVSTLSGFVQVSTNGLVRLKIENDGAWEVDGGTGVLGNVLVSSGPNNPPFWESLPTVLQYTVGDETTAITAGTNKFTVRVPAPVGFFITGVRASLTTAQASGTIFTVDINANGTTILSTKITIDNTEKTSTTAAVQPVLSTTSLSDDTELTIDVDQIGDGTATGLKITLIGRPDY